MLDHLPVRTSLHVDDQCRGGVAALVDLYAADVSLDAKVEANPRVPAGIDRAAPRSVHADRVLRAWDAIEGVRREMHVEHGAQKVRARDS